ncbi:MAG TPA: hypothetical protein VJP80_00410, partial [Candidatus Saccharimonadales bacterium]|nr:hypothetical protein [Candidatus Saccharimonadales bacterium]
MMHANEFYVLVITPKLLNHPIAIQALHAIGRQDGRTRMAHRWREVALPSCNSHCKTRLAPW